jgi:hypothetical protein
MMVNFRKMKDALESGVGVECESECRPGRNAYVNALFERTWAQMALGDIHICPPYWDLGAAQQAKIFMHELSHYALNTRDWAGDWDRRGAEDGYVTLTGTNGASMDAYHIQEFMDHDSLEVLAGPAGNTGALDACFPPMR